MPIREAIALAATPWEWKSRAAVVTLVVVAVLLPIAWIVMEWTDDDGPNLVVAVILYGGLGWLLFVRPAVRSLRRWDERHRAARAT